MGNATNSSNYYMKSNVNHNKQYSNISTKNSTRLDISKSLTERSMQINKANENLTRELLFCMKETQSELDLERIRTERSNVEIAIKLKQQMLRKNEEKKTKKDHLKDDHTDKESVNTGRGGHSKYGDKLKVNRRGTKLKNASKNEGNFFYNSIGSTYASQQDPNEPEMDKIVSNIKNDEKMSEMDGKNVLEFKQKFRNQYGMIFDQDEVNDNKDLIDNKKLIPQSSKFYNNGFTSFNHILNEDKDAKHKFDYLRSQQEADPKNIRFLKYQQENNKKKSKEINNQVCKTYHNHFHAYSTIVKGFKQKQDTFYGMTRLVNPKTGASVKIHEDLKFYEPEAEESVIDSAKIDEDAKKKRKSITKQTIRLNVFNFLSINIFFFFENLYEFA